MQPELQRLAWYEKSATGQTCRCGRRTSEGYGLTTLECHQPVEAPAANNLVFYPCSVTHVTLPLTEGELITPAKVEDIPYVKARQSVIRMDSVTRNRWCTVAIHSIGAKAHAPTIEQVMCVGEHLRIRIGSQEV